MNLFTKITKGNEDNQLFEAGVIGQDGRLTDEGRDLFLDLIFSGMDSKEARAKIVQQVKDDKKRK